MKNIAVTCTQENRVIGNLVKEDDDLLTVDAIKFIRNWRPVDPSYKFVTRPKLGTLLKCPRCNGMLSIEGSCSLNDEELGAQPDGLLIGQFTVE